MFPNQNKSNNAPVTKNDEEDRPNINGEIRAYKVRLIDQSGNNVGVVDTRDALTKARDAALDLVEVSPDATPPVCKIMDFRKYVFEQKKRAKENSHKSPEDHEIRLSPNICQNDLETKARKAQEFLEDGSKVVLTFKVKGREAKKVDFIKDVINRFYVLVEKYSTLENKGGVYILHPK